MYVLYIPDTQESLNNSEQWTTADSQTIGRVFFTIFLIAVVVVQFSICFHTMSPLYQIYLVAHYFLHRYNMLSCLF